MVPGNVYVAEVNGGISYVVGGKIQALKKGASLPVNGARIETNAGASVTLVYSNGTAIFIDENTILEVQKFVQKPFGPGADTKINEPSASVTLGLVQQGRILVKTNKLVTGTSMIYLTPKGQAKIRGQEVIINVRDRETTLSVISGDVTFMPSNAPIGDPGQVISSGQTASLSGNPGQTVSSAATVVVTPLDTSAVAGLSTQIASLDRGQKSVLFGNIDSAISQEMIPGKAYVAETHGSVSYMVDGKTIVLKVGDTVPVQGARIETSEGSSLVLVYSNGTGIFIDQNTVVQIEKFTQVPFPAGIDTTVLEPSISNTFGRIEKGRIVLYTNQLATGTSMIYVTPTLEVKVRGQDVVIDTNGKDTTVTVVKGDVTVTPVNATSDTAGEVLTAGQTASSSEADSGTIQVTTASTSAIESATQLSEAAERAQQVVVFETVTSTATQAGSSSGATTTTTTDVVAKVVIPTTLTVAQVTFAVSPTSFVYNGSSQGPTITASPSNPYDTSGTATAVAAGTYTVTATATGNATGTSGSVVWTIAKATPVVTWPSPSSITYGTAISAAQLDAAADVPGTFTYSVTSGSILDAGTYTLTVVFTPTDSSNYNSVTSSVTLVVDKAAQAAPTFAQTGTTIAYGSTYTPPSPTNTGQGTLVWSLGSGTTAKDASVDPTTGAISYSSDGVIVLVAYYASTDNYTASSNSATYSVTINVSMSASSL